MPDGGTGDRPYVWRWCFPFHVEVVAHSVGTWNAFEFLALARSQGLPMPQQAFLSAMAAPDIHPQQRPWRQQRMLPEADFMVICAHLCGSKGGCNGCILLTGGH